MNTTSIYNEDSYGEDSYREDSYGEDSYREDSYGEDSYEDTIAKIYDDNLNDIKDGIYGKFIEDNHDGTYTIDDGTRHVKMKIQGNYVVFCNTYTTYPCEWTKASRITPIKDRRHEQLYFENRTQIPNIDGIFEEPNYFKVAKNLKAMIMYMFPMDYMEYVAKGFGSTLTQQIEHLNKDRIKKYANDMLKGDLFPLPSLMYEESRFNQEGRHRAMAVQYLIDKGKAPKDTVIPVVIVTNVQQ